MRKLPHTAAEDLLEIIMRRYERASTLLTSNRPGADWGKLLNDTAAVTALLDRVLHHTGTQVRTAELAHQGRGRFTYPGCHDALSGRVRPSAYV